MSSYVALAASMAVSLPAVAATTIQVSNFAELETALSSCSPNTISPDTVVELTSDIVVTDVLRIGKGTQNLTIQSEQGSHYKLTPASGFDDSFLTIGGTWCASSGAITDLTIKDLDFAEVFEIQGGITLGPVYIGALADDAESTIVFDNVGFIDNLNPNFGSLSPAGLRIDEGTVTIKNCVFQNNTANGGISGGALFTGSNSMVTVMNTDFINNGEDLPLGGGAAYIKGEATFDTCTFSGNMVTSKGGAVALDASSSKSVTFTDCVFSDNAATSGGKDLYLKSSGHDVTFTPCLPAPDCSAAAGGCPCGGGGYDGGDDLDMGLGALADGIEAAVSLGLGIIIGIAVGGFVIFAAIIGCCVYCCCFKNRKVGVEGETKVIMVQQGAPQAQPAAPTAA